jgi:hypothetical protein
LGSRSLKLRAPASQEMGSLALDLSTPAGKIEPCTTAKPCCCQQEKMKIGRMQKASFRVAKMPS